LVNNATNNNNLSNINMNNNKLNIKKPTKTITPNVNNTNGDFFDLL
jgi:hypothetical protein